MINRYIFYLSVLFFEKNGVNLQIEDFHTTSLKKTNISQ